MPYKTISTAEHDAVVAHVQRFYIDAITKNKPELLAQGAHQDARIQGLGLDELFAPFLSENVTKSGGHADWRSRIDILGITPTTAAVRVEFDWGDKPDLKGYTDFLSLVKFDEGGWKIVNKVFQAYLE
ncbi:hypothetical protein Q8F55_006008 [Vanrija albida]|uniref:SnoaL-like domain-containing protein n=1 Tax=Vanrija albida TaxID=181172 RepID=A0ABR3Q353_9TREE